MTRTAYVVGFAFDAQQRNVVLVKKLRPTWQENLYNGVGGHVEDKESFSAAMEREFREETGVTIPAKDWRTFGTLVGRGYMVRCLTASTDEVNKVKTMTDEKIVLQPLNYLRRLRMIPNLGYLIPLALDAEQVGVPLFNYGR